MKRMYKISERIYNPFSKDLISSTQYLFKKYQDNTDVYISFTEQDKLGINPRSKYDTPIGIYTYPLNEILLQIKLKGEEDSPKKIGDFVPFAGDHPWVWIIEPDLSQGKFIKNIGSNKYYEYKDYYDDLDILEEKYGNNFMNWYELTKEWHDESRIKKPGGFIWNATRNLAKIIVNNKERGNTSIEWNKIFRKDLEYIGIADIGHKIIHPNEPAQCVFFSKSGFNIIEKIENTGYGITPDEAALVDKANEPKFLKDLENKFEKMFIEESGASTTFIPILIVGKLKELLQIYINQKHEMDIVDIIFDLTNKFISAPTTNNMHNIEELKYISDQINKLIKVATSSYETETSDKVRGMLNYFLVELKKRKKYADNLIASF